MTLRRNKGLGEAEDWLSKLRSVHVDQIYPAESADAYSPLLFRMLVVIMAISLILSIVLGIVLAFRSIRQKSLVWLSLALGVAVPILMLWLGQK